MCISFSTPHLYRAESALLASLAASEKKSFTLIELTELTRRTCRDSARQLHQQLSGLQAAGYVTYTQPKRANGTFAPGCYTLTPFAAAVFSSCGDAGTLSAASLAQRASEPQSEKGDAVQSTSTVHNTILQKQQEEGGPQPATRLTAGAAAALAAFPADVQAAVQDVAKAIKQPAATVAQWVATGQAAGGDYGGAEIRVIAEHSKRNANKVAPYLRRCLEMGEQFVWTGELLELCAKHGARDVILLPPVPQAANQSRPKGEPSNDGQSRPTLAPAAGNEWDRVSALLAQQINRASFNTWLRPCTAEREGSTVTLTVPDAVHAYWVPEYYTNVLTAAYQQVAGVTPELAFVVMDGAEDAAAAADAGDEVKA